VKNTNIYRSFFKIQVVFGGEKVTDHNDFKFAHLNQQQLKELLSAEDNINQETTDPVYVIAYRKE